MLVTTRNNTTLTVTDSIDDANNNNDTNEEQSNITWRSVDLSVEMERKSKEENDADGEVGPLHDVAPALE